MPIAKTHQIKQLNMSHKIQQIVKINYIYISHVDDLQILFYDYVYKKQATILFKYYFKSFITQLIATQHIVLQSINKHNIFN